VHHQSLGDYFIQDKEKDKQKLNVLANHKFQNLQLECAKSCFKSLQQIMKKKKKKTMDIHIIAFNVFVAWCSKS